MEHCNNCSKCCELIMLDNVSPARVADMVKEGRVDAVYSEILHPITRDEAMARNAKAVIERESHCAEAKLEVFFYSCPQLVGGRCSVYSRRPSMCSNYPFKRSEMMFEEQNVNSHAWLSKRQYKVNEPRYSDNCSYLPGMIPVVNL